MSFPRLSPRRLTAAAALGVAAVLACAGPASAATPADAANWLAGSLTDGDHVELGNPPFAYDGTAADSLYALAAAGGHDDSVAAIDAYLQANVESYADPAGTGPFGGGPYGGSLAKLALAAETVGDDPHAYGGTDLLAVLVSTQCTATGPNCKAPGDFSKIFSSVSQSLGVLALQRSPLAADHQTAASPAVTRLLALQCRDGLFTGSLPAPGRTCATGDVDSSAYAVQALAAVLGPDAAVVARTLTAVAAAQDASGGFDGAAGLNTNTTGVALSAFSLQPVTFAAAITAGTAFVTGLQRADGAYPVSAGDSTDDSARLATPQALLGVLGRNLAGIVVAVPPTTPPTTAPAPTDPGTPGAPGAPAGGAVAQLPETGVTHGDLAVQLTVGLGTVVAGASALWFGIRRRPVARHHA